MLQNARIKIILLSFRLCIVPTLYYINIIGRNCAITFFSLITVNQWATAGKLWQIMSKQPSLLSKVSVPTPSTCSWSVQSTARAWVIQAPCLILSEHKVTYINLNMIFSLFWQCLSHTCTVISEPVIITLTVCIYFLFIYLFIYLLLSIISVLTDRVRSLCTNLKCDNISPSQQSTVNSFTEILQNFPEVKVSISGQLIKSTLK